MTGTQSLTQQSLTNPAANAQARVNFLSSALRQTLALSPDTGIAGGTTSRKLLENVGVITSLDLLVSVTVTNNAASGGAALVPSVGFPYNILSKIVLTDYNNTNRVNLTGVQLMQRNAVHRSRIPYAANSPAEGGMSGGQQAYPTSVATGSVAAAASATVQFSVRVPVAIGETNTIGALLMQAITGQVYLNTSLAANSATGGYDQPFTGDFSISNGSIQVVQNYLQPQGAAPDLPAMDLSTIYELNGSQQDSSNIAVGLPKYINAPNARIVHGMYLTFYNGALNYGSDLQSMKVRASGNTDLLTDPPQLWFNRLREHLGADLMPGFYWFNTSRVPILTNYLGQVQMVLTPSSVGTNPYIDVMSENTYTSGTPLPGIG
jgi:hypothetical protein